MAVTSIHSIKATVGAAISYITDGAKTVNGLYVQSYACRDDSRGAAEDFRTVRATGTGRTTILAHHIIQSFEPGEITPKQALQIGEELCDRLLKGDYQYVLAVHTDKNHMHCHIIFSNTNLYNGLSFTTEHNQGKVSERSWAKLREISDEICQEHGLSVIEPKGKGVSHFERDMQIQGKSWKDKLRAKIAEVAFYSKSLDDFFQRCTEYGIEYVYTPRNKVKLKFRLKDEGQQRFTRADTLGADYTPERIAEQIEQIQKAHAVTERLEEKKVTEKTVEHKSEYVYKPPSNDEFFRAFGVHLDEVDEPTTPTPKPTESQAPEKKEDEWAEIRGMRNSDQMIADLESGGITSLRELRSFFWNFKHDDDHSDELSELKTKIKAIDKLIKMMKQRSKYSAIYKQYKECSAFRQKSFRKKNADAIDSYEQADQYIKEHIKDYAIDGTAPKRSELEKVLTDLKMEYNTLVPEHNIFLKKKATVAPYLKTVRTYLENQKKQERDSQYRDRTRTQQKKKDTLE